MPCCTWAKGEASVVKLKPLGEARFGRMSGLYHVWCVQAGLTCRSDSSEYRPPYNSVYWKGQVETSKSVVIKTGGCSRGARMLQRSRNHLKIRSLSTVT